MGGDDDRLSRSAIVTGAAGGIGRAIAVRLARDGLALPVVDLPPAAGGPRHAADRCRGPGGGGGG